MKITKINVFLNILKFVLGTKHKLNGDITYDSPCLLKVVKLKINYLSLLFNVNFIILYYSSQQESY